MATKFQHNSGFLEKESVDIIIKKNEKEFLLFKNILKIFKNAEEGDKLMKNPNYIEFVFKEGGKNSPKTSKLIDQEKYYLIKNTTMQSIWRWWYGETQQNTFKYIEEEMDAFTKFLDKILDLSKKYHYYSTFKKLTTSITSFIVEILPGLYSFKQTYPNYKELITLIDSIILTLLDFKNNIKSNNANKKKDKLNKHRKLSL